MQYVFIFLIMLLFVACETVSIEERVVYEDGTPVARALVHQYTDIGYNGYAVTNENGEWSLDVPVDTLIYLCIENHRDNDAFVCYEGYLITPTLESGENKMKRI